MTDNVVMDCDVVKKIFVFKGVNIKGPPLFAPEKYQHVQVLEMEEKFKPK